VGVTACGGDDEEPTPTPAAQQPADDLQPVKDFLLEHTERLTAATADLREQAEAYHALAEDAGFDYEQLLADKRAEVNSFVEDAQKTFAEANPAYEEMEGVVAGVPSLADYDVIIDAGADKSDPENAAPITLETPAGKTYDRPGNFNYLIETSAYGTEPKFAAKGVEPDLDGDGEVTFGEAVPDADFYVTAAREFLNQAPQPLQPGNAVVRMLLTSRSERLASDGLRATDPLEHVRRWPERPLRRTHDLGLER
jgi:hypothetical protein